MNKAKLLLAVTLFTGVSTSAYAFDLGGIVGNAVKSAVQETIEDTTKDATKSAMKGVAQEAGVEGADKYVDLAVDNKDAIQNNAAGLKATTDMMSSGGIGAVSGALSAASIASETVRNTSETAE